MWPHFRGLKIPKLSAPVSLLIGIDNPELFWTLEEKRGSLSQPYAVRTSLGWSLIGAVSGSNKSKSAQINFARKRDQELNQRIEQLWKMDAIPEYSNSDRGMSKKDRLAFFNYDESEQMSG